MITLPLSLPYSRQTLLAFIFGLCACLTSFAQNTDFLSEEALYEVDFDDAPLISDLLEPANRVIFRFNDFFYNYLAEPVSYTYQLSPVSVRLGIKNFFSNLGYPVRLTGNLLQGRIKGAWLETRRFGVNSTVGLLGVLDLASDMEGLERIESEDAGQVLGSWGLGEGIYLVLPFVGPSNLRDLGGLLVDRLVNPWVEPFCVLDSEAKTIYSVGDGVSSLPGYLQIYREMKGSSVDPYSSLKDAFTQYRRAAIKK